ncbi:MAG: DNA repair protein RecO [Planctomycetota bacterium]
MSRRIGTRGLVLGAIPFSDTSQIVRVFGREKGIISLLAKGALRPPRRAASFPSPFDLAGWYDILYMERRGELQLALEARLVEGFPHLRRSLPLFLEACFALEVMGKMFSPEDPHPQFLRGALSHLKLLGVGRGRGALRVHFLSSLLGETGFAPSWSACAECGAALDRGGAAVRLPAGVLCGRCRAPGDPQVSNGVLCYLERDATLPWGHIPALDPAPPVLEGAWSLLRDALLHHLGRPPRSLRYLQGMGGSERHLHAPRG